ATPSATAGFYRNRRRFRYRLDLFVSFDRRERHQLMLDGGETRSGHSLDHLARRLVGVLRFVDGDDTVRVNDDAGLAVGGIHLVLFEALPGSGARHAAAGPVVDAVAAQMGLVRRAEDEARVAVTARNQEGMSGVRVVVADREGARGALAMDVDPAKLRVMLPKFGWVHVHRKGATRAFPVGYDDRSEEHT